MKKAILLVGHGSKVEQANEALHKLCRLVEKKAAAGEVVAHAYLQFASPALEGAIANLDAQQVGEVVVVPIFLYEGVHFSQDIREFVEREAARRPHIRLVLAPVLGVDERMAEIVWDRVREAKGD
jgi:sirohydrochlorin ferrochelatase